MEGTFDLRSAPGEQMEKAILLACIFILSGCAGLPVNVDNASPVGVEQTARVGDIFFEREIMTGEDNHAGSVFYGDAQRIELRVKAASQKRLALDYSEFMKPVAGPYGGYRIQEPWLKKASFDRAVEYDLSESKLVPFQRYLFEVLDVAGGTVKFKRVQ